MQETVSYTVHSFLLTRRSEQEYMEDKFLSQGSKGESVKHGGGKTSDLLCNESWRINTGMVEDSVTHSCVQALNRTTNLLKGDRTIVSIV